MTENINLCATTVRNTSCLKVKHNRDVLQDFFLGGKQNIALRGHRETLLYGEDNPHDTNSGNFLALLRLLADSGDVILREYNTSAPKNAQYWSCIIQNDLTCAVEEGMQRNFLEEV